jgi:hypothetical protein
MDNSQTPVVQAFKAEKRHWMALGRSRVQLPNASVDLDFIGVTVTAAGRELKSVARDGAAKLLAGDEHGSVLVINKAPAGFELSFAAIVKDAGGNAWDLIFNGTLRVTDPLGFLEASAFAVVTPETPLSRPLMESWLGGRIQFQVRDAVRGLSISDLREKDKLPACWWQNEINGWLASSGVNAAVTGVRWESADAARAESERASERESERIAQERDRQFKAELREAQARLDYGKEKARIDADTQLLEADRVQQLRVHELNHRSELMIAETEIENARRSAEKCALEHELSMARLRNDVERATIAQSRIDESEQRHEELVDALDKAHELLNKLKLDKSLLQELAGQNWAKANQAAERLVSSEFGFVPAQLEILGFPVVNQSFVETVSKKNARDSQVQLYKAELKTRDIGAAKVMALRIGQSLQFTLTARRSGYLTVLNIGTSGNAYLQVPSALIGGRNIRIDAGRSYALPGPELFPWQWDYREEGPAGWEHIIALVTDEPFIPVKAASRSSDASPIVRLTPEEIGSLFESLNEMRLDSWTAGLLSFLVV